MVHDKGGINGVLLCVYGKSIANGIRRVVEGDAALHMSNKRVDFTDVLPIHVCIYIRFLTERFLCTVCRQNHVNCVEDIFRR